ncbi:unnamed protein product, partial [Meganyctiphanes norvegica]
MDRYSMSNGRCEFPGTGNVLAVDESAKNEDSQNLILIILGGFRWDYIDIHLNSSHHGFKHILQNGGRAKYIEPVFPATTLPNLQTIATGLYPEQHGIVDNYMYDRSTWQTFSMDDPDSARNPEWWDAAEPLWVTARKHGLSHVYTADAARCNLPWADLIPTYCGPLQGQLSTALECIENNSCNLVISNIGSVEAAGLQHGPKSSEVAAAVREVDSALTCLWKNLTSKGMVHRTNVVLVSDHGITPVGSSDVKEISLDACVDWNVMIATVGCGGYIVFQPIQGTQITVWNALKACHQIKGKTLNAMTKLLYPEWHYSHNYRIMKIIVIANKGFFLQCPNISAALDPTWQGEEKQQGMAGYDNTFGNNPDMRGVLLAKGPAFHPGSVTDGVHQVDVYSLLCNALQLPCIIGEGNTTRIAPLLTSPPEPETVAEASTGAAASLVHPRLDLMAGLGMGILYLLSNF